MNIAGEDGAHSMYAGFNYAIQDETQETLVDSNYELKWD